MNKVAYASGSSVSLKSFQSFTVNGGLLAKVVEAVKAGEKDARTSGDVKSFEVFYAGFRQNISIGRIYIIPVKVASSLKDFPVALLYGTVVRELNLGEEVADLIEKKIGESEFDEYSQLDIQKLKDTLFYDADSEEYRSLVVFAPSWSNIRDYVAFKFTADEDKLSNLIRHMVFSVYFNPAVSSAFDALMTSVDTNKLDVTDITPKLTYPFLSENPLRAFPDLQKTGGWAKSKVFLTVKTADAITKDILDPQELNVFEALDSALTESTFPETEAMDEVADFKGPTGTNDGNAEVPQVEGIENIKSDETFRNFIEKGKESSKSAAKNCTICGKPIILSPSAKERAAKDVTGKSPEHYTNLFTTHPECALAKRKQDTSDLMNKTKGAASTSAALDEGTELRHRPDYGEKGSFTQKMNEENAKLSSAPFETPFTNVGPGTAAHDNAEKAIAVKVDSISTKGEAPIGIELDKAGLPVHTAANSVQPKSKLPEYLKTNYQKCRHGYYPKGSQCAKCSHPDGNLSEEWLNNSDKVASLLTASFDDEPAAMSTKAKAAAQKREDELNKKYAGRKKTADVPLTEDSIWSDLMEDFGEAPQVELPGEGSGKSDSEAKTDKGESKPVEKSVENEEKSESKPETTGPKSKLFKDKAEKKEVPKEEPKAEVKTEAPKAEPKVEEPKEEKKEEPKEASTKTAMLYMNDYDIEVAKRRYANDPVLSAATNFLSEFKEQVDSHSDGWAYWRPPVQAAAQLMTLIQSGKADTQSLTKAMAPIKAFMTRRGLAAGMTMPALRIRKGAKSLVASAKLADAIQPDYAEAKSKVVSPDTVDADIKQPTESVEEAAKVSGYLKSTDKLKPHNFIAEDNGKDCRICGLYGSHGLHLNRSASQKKADDVSGDLSEAKSKVVNPDTIDTDISQPTKSVEEAAKVATPGVKVVKVVGAHDQYPGEHGCRTYVGETNTQGQTVGEGHVCMKPEVVKIDGRMYCEQHRPDKKKKGSDVSGDISEAKSEVVSPDTVDTDISQPTESVEEAAKVAAAECPVAIDLARRLIDIGDEIAHDVAAENGQIFDNVKGMEWFIQAVADEIAGEEVTVGEYLNNVEADEAEEIAGVSDVPASELEFEERFAAAGDDQEEAVEMGLGDGDLADLAANLPSPVPGVITADMHPEVPTNALVKRIRELNAKGVNNIDVLAHELNVPADRVRAAIAIIKGN